MVCGGVLVGVYSVGMEVWGMKTITRELVTGDDRE